MRAAAPVLLSVLVALIPVSCAPRRPRSEGGIKTAEVPLKQKGRSVGPLTQGVSLSFDHELLGAVLRSITVLTGVDAAIHPEIMSPSKIEKKRITFHVADMSLRHALDWLVRQIDADYQVNDDGSVLITRGYMPIESAATGSFFVPGLYLEKEAADLTAILDAAILPVTSKRDDVVIVRRMSRNLLVVQAPPPVLKRIKDIVNALGDTKPVSPLPLPADRLKNILDRKVLCNYRRVAVLDLIGRIRKETGLNIGFCGDLLWKRRVRREINMMLGHVSVREALDELVSRAGFERWDLEPSRGVWLYGRDENRHRPSGEMPWYGTIVRAYPAAGLVRKKRLEEIEQAVRAVCGRPSSATLVKYSRATGKVLVIEEPDVMRRVEEYLKLAHLVGKERF